MSSPTSDNPFPSVPLSRVDEKPWLEHQVHIQQNDENNETNDENNGEAKEDDLHNFVFHLFDQTNGNDNDEGYEIYTFGDLRIRGQEELGHSTGLSVCLGAVVLHDFLKARCTMQEDKKPIVKCSQKDNDENDKEDTRKLRGLFRGQRVLELGAGTGLCGLFAKQHLGAESVVLTDGDTRVMQNMRYNVAQNNIDVAFEKNRTHIVCEQLIWGDTGGVQRLVERYGRPNIILAADCLYMSPAVRPFWQTIDKLFGGGGGDGNEDRLQVVFYVLVSASQVPPGMITDEAEKLGFTSELVDKDVYRFHRSMGATTD